MILCVCVCGQGGVGRKVEERNVLCSLILRPLNCTRLGKRRRSKQGGEGRRRKRFSAFRNVHILEVPEVSLSGWQSGKGGKNVFQNQLSMLLVPRENLRGKQTNSDHA